MDQQGFHPPGPAEPHPDLALVREVLGGSLSAWHAFIDRYSALLYSVLCRYFHDAEELRSSFVDVLDTLYRRKLAAYRGESSLSTWLVCVTRNAAIDALRKREGRGQRRRDRPLSEIDRSVRRICKSQGLDIEAIVHRLNQERGPTDRAAVLEALSRIEDISGQGNRGKALGLASARLEKFLERLPAEADAAGPPWSVEARLMESEARRTHAMLRELIGRLPADEQRVLFLRFVEGWTANRIARELGIQGPRRVYSLLQRSFRTLRRWLEQTGA
jgi:RNA polymerase sigma factor (sigma-70 family)